MKLGDFTPEKQGKNIRLVTTVADTSGAREYELALAGPAPAIHRIFAKSDFSITIDPKRGAEESQKEFAAQTRVRLDEFARIAALKGSADIPVFKKTPVTPSRQTSVFLSLRRMRGEGTFWGPWSFSYFLPTGWNIFVFPPPLVRCMLPLRPLRVIRTFFCPAGSSTSH